MKVLFVCSLGMSSAVAVNALKKEAKAKANSDQANESSQEKGKGSVKLPDTGEQAFYMTLALALCGLAAVIVAIYLYRRYRERKKLKDIHFD